MVEYFSRWYDKDPILSMSMKTLQNTDDASQIKIALNLIKVIIEHNIESSEFEGVEDILSAVEDGMTKRGNARWYDLDETIRTAIQMLEACSSEARQKIATEMANLVVNKIKEGDEDYDYDEEDEVTVLDLDNEEI